MAYIGYTILYATRLNRNKGVEEYNLSYMNLLKML